MNEDALEFLYKINPSLRNEDLKNMNTFSGEFLVYCISQALKEHESK